MLIAAQGQVSNVGVTMEGTCAAQRAGISRMSPLPGVTVYDPDELETEVTGAPIRELTDGFFTHARWPVLGLESLADLARTRGVALDDAAYWRSTALVWVLPELDFERFRIPEDGAEEFLGLACTKVLLEVSRLPVGPEQIQFVRAGIRGVALACDRARELLSSGAERVILLATDSLVDPLSIMWLQQYGRLKSPEHPTGLCPGESGVCLVLRVSSPEPTGSGPSARILGWHASPAAGDEEPEDPAAWRTETAPDTGRALADAIERALAKAGSRGIFRGDLILDLNGENWRALVWGHAQVRLQRVIDFAASKAVIPATSFGDIGAAGAAAGLCIASHSFARGCAMGTHAIVASVSDRGEVSAIVVGAAGA